MARILVIEDDPGMVDFLTEALGSWDHEAIVVSDGREAYRRIYLAWPPFDLVLCDLELPSMQGPDLLRRVQKQLVRQTPVLVVSGKDRLLDQLRDVAEWVYGILRKPFPLEELKLRVEGALRERADLATAGEAEQRILELQQRVQELVEENARLFEEARLDPLTDLPNRRRLQEDLGRRHANVERYGAPFALALCDVDDFRRFNVGHGYEGGDVAIRHLAALLRQVTREGDTVYRYGGDEFVIVMEAQDLDMGLYVAERICTQVAAAAVPQAIGGVSERLTLSMGIAAAIPGARRSMAALIREANRHLDEAKLAGGNSVRPKAWRSTPAAGPSPDLASSG